MSTRETLACPECKQPVPHRKLHVHRKAKHGTIVRCFCECYVASKNVRRHNLRAHQVDSNDLIQTVFLQCPFCPNEIHPQRFLTHCARHHADHPNGTQAALLHADLVDGLIVDGRSLIRISNRIRMEHLLLLLQHLKVQGRRFCCILDEGVLRSALRQGFCQTRLLESLSNRLPWRFEVVADRVTAIERMSSFAGKTGISIVTGDPLLLSNERLRTIRVSAGGTSGEAVLLLNEHVVAPLAKSTQLDVCEAIVSELEAGEPSPTLRYCRTADKSCLRAIPKQVSAFHGVTPMNRDQLWLIFRIEWELRPRLQRLLGIQSQRDKRAWHELIDMVESQRAFVANQEQIRVLRRIATIRNKLMHEADVSSIDERGLDKDASRIVDFLRGLSIKSGTRGPFPFNDSYYLERAAEILDLSKRVEYLMAARLNATGNGMNAKMDSIKEVLSGDLRRRIASLGAARNDIVHGGKKYRSGDHDEVIRQGRFVVARLATMTRDELLQAKQEKRHVPIGIEEEIADLRRIERARAEEQRKADEAARQLAHQMSELGFPDVAAGAGCGIPIVAFFLGGVMIVYYAGAFAFPRFGILWGVFITCLIYFAPGFIATGLAWFQTPWFLRNTLEGRRRFSNRAYLWSGLSYLCLILWAVLSVWMRGRTL